MIIFVDRGRWVTVSRLRLSHSPISLPARPALGGLLLWDLSTTHILPHIRGINDLSEKSLDSLPTLSNSRWDIGVLNLLVNTSGKLTESALDELALGESCSKEDGVDTEQDPGAFGEGDGGEEEAEPQKDLEHGHQQHGAIIVVLDKATDAVSERRLGFGRAGRLRSASCCGFRWLNSWNYIGAGVCSNVED
jgi:hypothetical protein